MDEEEDDVRRKSPQIWPSSQLQIKLRESTSANGMQACGAEPRRFLYGNAELLLLAPPIRSQPPDAVRREMDPRPEPVEILIGQKLQLIGDQFYQEHMMHHRNQRNQEPLWRRVAATFYTLMFGRDAEAQDARADRR
ncbi:BCL2 modifying factor 1 [Pseudorasbora parva]|uniref:BCL2 modifying factor 1 n=1 Tax=Pseudorasbora parva TaxID=51549 RepID=UPI00351EE360